MSEKMFRYATDNETLVCGICFRRVYILIYGVCSRCTAAMDAREEPEDDTEESTSEKGEAS